MSIATISKPSVGPAIKPRPGLGSRLSTAAAANQDSTMATVYMTRLQDARLQNQLDRLMVLGKNRKVLHTYPLNRQISSVGRSRHNNVRIDDALVSAKHLTISSANSASVVNDLDSSNGTFINGRRLSGFQALNDGDEIMIGKTILQFAARRQTVRPANAARRRLFVIKRGLMATAAMCCLAVTAAFVFQIGPGGLERFTAKALAPVEKSSQASRPAAARQADSPQLPVVKAGAAGLQQIAQDRQIAAIKQALADYAAGRLDRARETLQMLVAPGRQTPAVAQARQMLSMLAAIQQTHAQAVKAQAQKKYTRALEYWDRLLAFDSELIGNRPSYLAIQAEQRIQGLTYDYAVDALRQKNHQKVRQLCQVILQIDPQNQQALALLAKIESIS